jgi:hypothetical protein
MPTRSPARRRADSKEKKMGFATDRARRLMQEPLTDAESAERQAADRELNNPGVTLDGAVVDRPAPKAAPQQVITPDTGTWD